MAPNPWEVGPTGEQEATAFLCSPFVATSQLPDNLPLPLRTSTLLITNLITSLIVLLNHFFSINRSGVLRSASL